MANLLTITKETGDYFTFVVNGDIANAVKNTRNDLLIIGIYCHFKTANGANIIKEQNITFGNITITDGLTSLVPTSNDDLFTKLYSVGFFDWINGSGSGTGVNRFDELLDTFQYFGKDGQGVRVNESELKLEPYVLPNTDYLDLFPNPLVPDKILKVKSDNSGYELVDAFNVVTQLIREGQTETAPSEAVVYLALQAISSTILGLQEGLEFIANGIDDFIDIGVNQQPTGVFLNSVILRKDDWSFSGTIMTFTFVPDLGAIIQLT